MDKLQKAVWITGASSGIGKELTLEFARKDEIVIATSRRVNLIENYKKELGEKESNIIPVQLDIEDLKSIENFYKKFSKDFFIAALINNAGVTSFKSAQEDSLEEIKRIIEVNLLGAIYSIKKVLPQMIEMNYGTIINILSVVTHKVFLGSSAYSASKAGLLAYTNSLREEIRENNIRIINIIPGATKTPIWNSSVLEKKSHRMMSPEEIAKLVYYVYSIKSNLVTEEIVIRPIQGDLE
ncbi:MAG: SDR family oxidoreductase [Melioribacter sp.]|uniref:SDR family oxidoreductase n=1 Tax=Rosettibacter primus TaxID=3111523 RepID=UPI00247F02AC|nr:SDR family oxidoreductase [Melioribacter sp.]